MMLAASNPVAVLARARELGADPRLITIISRESIKNDGCTVVLSLLGFCALSSLCVTGNACRCVDQRDGVLLLLLHVNARGHL